MGPILIQVGCWAVPLLVFVPIFVAWVRVRNELRRRNIRTSSFAWGALTPYLDYNRLRTLDEGKSKQVLAFETAIVIQGIGVLLSIFLSVAIALAA